MESAKPGTEERPPRQRSNTGDNHQEERTEMALVASEEKYRAIIECIPVGMHMYRLEDDGSLVFFDSNPAASRILGVDHKRFVGLTIEEAFPALAETEVPERYRRVAETGETWQSDEITYEGGQISGAFEVHAFQTSPGRMVAAFFDITDRKRTQAQLIRSAKLAAVGELAARVAHEINNPLTSVLGFSELLLKNPALDEETRADLTIVVEEARRARDIVRGLSEFSRQGEPTFNKVSVNQVLRDSVDLLRRQLEDRHVVIEECYGRGIPLLMMDVGTMKQVFLNLIANGLKAMPDGGTMSLRSQTLSDKVAIHISDTGPGVSDDILPRIFEPFFTGWKDGERMGLGLAVSLGIVQEHGGRITVESRIGEGSTFTVWLPIDPAAMEESHGK